MPSARLLWTAIASLALVAADTPDPEPTPAQLDEQTLQRAAVGVDGPALVRFFRERTLTPEKRRRVEGLIEQLRERSFAKREKATEDLAAEGELAAPLLRRAMVGAELELIRRAEKVIASIKFTDPELIASAARQFARTKPEGAAAVLLAYLPNAPEEAGEDVRGSLAQVAIVEGRPDKALLRDLEAADPFRRGAAVEALIRAGTTEQLRDWRKFAKDRDANVRFRAARALVERKDKEAVPVVIALLTELPAEQAWFAEEVLARLAGDQAPAVVLGREGETRKKCRATWDAWWTKHGAAVDLAKLGGAPRLLGHTLLVQHGGPDGDRVLEIGADGKTRWEVGSLQYAVDGYVLPGNRFLVTEHLGNRVSERNFKGEIVWKKEITGPITGQRLANGNTLVASHTQIIEVTPDGKDVFTYSAGDVILRGVHKPRNGPLAILTSDGNCVRLDANGKELKSFKSGHDPSWVSGFEVLPNGRVLVPQRQANKVVEFDPDGKVVWEAEVKMPKAAARLPNGHTLVTSFDTRSVVELDRAGKVVWERKDDYAHYRARRR
jgi:hypothetical protein